MRAVRGRTGERKSSEGGRAEKDGLVAARQRERRRFWADEDADADARRRTLAPKTVAHLARNHTRTNFSALAPLLLSSSSTPAAARGSKGRARPVRPKSERESARFHVLPTPKTTPITHHPAQARAPLSSQSTRHGILLLGL